jgi:hypothetical protein
MGKHFQQKALFEFADGFIVGDTSGVHLGHKVIQFAFHRNLFLSWLPIQTQ